MKAHKFLASLPETVSVLSPSPSWILTVCRVWIWFHSCTIALERGNEESRVLLVAGTSSSLKELVWQHLFCCFKILEYATSNCWVTMKTILNSINVQWEVNENPIPTDDLQCSLSTRNVEKENEMNVFWKERPFYGVISRKSSCKAWEGKDLLRLFWKQKACLQ